MDNITEGFAGELDHVHKLLVEEDTCRSPATDQLPSLDCGSSDDGGAGGKAHVWRPGAGQLAERLRPLVDGLRAADRREQAAATLSPSQYASLTDASQLDVLGVLDCFTKHITSMLDAISAEVGAMRHAQRLATLRRELHPGVKGAPRPQPASSLRFLRELAGTQMFAMHCFTAASRLEGQRPPGENGAADKGGSSAADHFIEEFVVAAASWGSDSAEQAAGDGDSEAVARTDSEATECSELGGEGGGRLPGEAEQPPSAAGGGGGDSRSASLKMSV